MTGTLMYHSIDDSRSPISMSPAAFEGHLAWLTSAQVRVVPLDAVLSVPPTGPDSVAVTFDDGFANIRPWVERLRAHDVPVTVFVVTRAVGETNAWGGVKASDVPCLPLLSWRDLEHLASIGATLAAHTRSHRPLSQLSSNEIDDELAGSQQDLADRLGIRPDHLAYPYGDVDARVAARAATFFKYSHTTECVPIGAATNPMRCPRIDMFYFRDPGSVDDWGRARFRARLGVVGARRLARHAILGGPFPGAPRRWTR